MHASKRGSWQVQFLIALSLIEIIFCFDWNFLSSVSNSHMKLTNGPNA